MNNQTDEKYLNKLHHDILTIMDEVDRICREHNLRYYLMCGTCIGAVRHKGFIPWDDDLDIAMPYKDFRRFISLVLDNTTRKSVLPDSLYLRWVSTEKCYHHSFAKVCLKGTVFQESNGPAAQNAGIFIDIFPLYSCSKSCKRIEKKNRLLLFVENCIHYKGLDHDKKESGIKNAFTRLVSCIFSNKVLYKIMLMIIHPQDENKSEYQVFFATPYPINRMFFPKSWHGEGKEMLFEGRNYFCPSEYDKYLKKIYGENVMQLPPEDKRKSHYPLRVVFSDGEEMFFEKAKIRVDYKNVLD